MGSNLDWDWETGLVIVNQRGVDKTSLVGPGMRAAHWVSKYGSVTFNQFGQEMPYGGMNETGLVIACSWLNQTVYPHSDARPSINLLQWIQYQLDNCRTVKEVLATDSRLRVYAPGNCARVHYLLCDSQGNRAIIEFLHGKMVSHQGTNVTFNALANDTYAASMDYALKHHVDAQSDNRSSLWRFCYAAQCSSRFTPSLANDDVKYAFNVLQKVSQWTFTAWSIVYDSSRRKIYFHTRSNPQNSVIDFSKINFSSDRPLQFANIEALRPKNGELVLHDLSLASQAKYLKTFIEERAVRQKFGDLMPEIKAQLIMLNGFHSAN